MPVRRYVALLRGINVGRANRVTMADLHNLLASLGYENVRTLLNSGNALFDASAGSSAAHVKRIQKALASELAITTNVVVKSASQIAAIAAENPLLRVANDPSRLLITVTNDPAKLSGLTALANANWSPERFVLGDHAAYLWCPNGVIKSKVAQTIARRLGEISTTRNWATIEKLNALLHDNDAAPP